MSVQSYVLETMGTPISWKSSGGTHVITPTSLAAGAARQGDKADLGAFYSRRFAVLVRASMASAAANLTTIAVYWSPSTSVTAGTENAGNASGADGSYATPAEYALQLILIGYLTLSNTAGTAIQEQIFEFSPPTQYGQPVWVNNAAVALGATATDHEFRLVPIVDAQATTITG